MKVAQSEKGTVQKKFPKKYFFTFLVQLLPISIYISVCSVVRPTEYILILPPIYHIAVVCQLWKELQDYKGWFVYLQRTLETREKNAKK